MVSRRAQGAVLGRGEIAAVLAMTGVDHPGVQERLIAQLRRGVRGRQVPAVGGVPGLAGGRVVVPELPPVGEPDRGLVHSCGTFPSGQGHCDGSGAVRLADNRGMAQRTPGTPARGLVRRLPRASPRPGRSGQASGPTGVAVRRRRLPAAGQARRRGQAEAPAGGRADSASGSAGVPLPAASRRPPPAGESWAAGRRMVATATAAPSRPSRPAISSALFSPAAVAT